MHLEFTAVFEKVHEGYLAFVEELPGANTQGETLEEARSNLAEAVRLVLEANGTLAEETLGGREVRGKFGGCVKKEKATYLPLGRKPTIRVTARRKERRLIEKDSGSGVALSTPTWETLEAFARARVQDFVQALLAEEVTELLGRGKSVRRAAVDAPVGYRNGFGKPRRLALTSGTITVRRPRVRDLAERFASRLLPLFARRTREVGALVPRLYLHGLAHGDFELALRSLLGEGAPLSPSSIARLKAQWQEEYATWARRRLDAQPVVYVWADGLYVKAGLEPEKAALLVVIGAFADGRKEVLAVTPGYRESTASWAAVLRELTARGLVSPQLVVADGHLGTWGALREVWPMAAERRCWNHYAELRIMPTWAQEAASPAGLAVRASA